MTTDWNRRKMIMTVDLNWIKNKRMEVKETSLSQTVFDNNDWNEQQPLQEGDYDEMRVVDRERERARETPIESSWLL